MTAVPGPATYLLPIRASEPPDAELTGYLRWISRRCRLIVVDGSEAAVFASAHAAWSSFALHIAPRPERSCSNGKVHGVLTGLDHVSTAALIIADDDVRYDDAALDAVVAELDRADVVVPQNYFSPMPWHARWDTARSLIARATGGDFPGTLGVRVEVLRSTAGYDGDVLFENLELIRTVEAAGGRCRRRSDILVARRPPTTRHFIGQRVRQAYDEFARPARLAIALSALPLVVLVGTGRRVRAVVLGAVGVTLVAESGRRRSGGAAVFPATSALFAPLWVSERAVCAWIALALRLAGGVRYSGGRLRTAANGRSTLRERHLGRRGETPVMIPAAAPSATHSPVT